ncbi:MAG: hypothetical protein NVS9B12_00430 [Vulcanimicrobiaceae bacterium]
MERIPLVPIALAFAAGSAAAAPLNFEQRSIVALVIAALCVWLCTASGTTGALRVGAALALACGLYSGRLHAQPVQKINQMHTMRYSATVLTCERETASGMAACSVLLDGGATVLASFTNPPAVAERVLLRGRLSGFDGPRNPGEPDKRSIEAERGLTAQLDNATVLHDAGPAPLTFAVGVARLRDIAGERLRRFLPDPFASIVAGELWGERSAIPADLRAEFQDTGTVHVLVTAGLHLAVVALLASALLRWLGVPRITGCVIAAAAIWAYVAFSGAHLPSLRAGAMITFALAARAAGAKAVSWSALAFAAIVVLLLSPQSVLSASFAMSFSCVGAILLTARPIEELFSRWTAAPSALVELLTLTLATQIGVWPLTAATFLIFAPYAVLANAAVVPVIGITMIVGALQIAFARVATLAQAFANLNTWLLTWMTGVIRLVSSLPHAHIVMTPAPLWAICWYDASLFLAAWLYKRGGFTAACAVLLTAAGLVLAPPPHIERRLQITMLDVGQADAIVIRTPAGHVFLVDAGGRLERGARTAADSLAERIGETVVVPYLVRSGVHHIDAILLSHPHGDHVGGAPPVLRELGANVFADSGQQ